MRCAVFCIIWGFLNVATTINLCSNRADHIFSLVTIAICTTRGGISCHVKHDSWFLVQICHMLQSCIGSSPYFEFLCALWSDLAARWDFWVSSPASSARCQVGQWALPFELGMLLWGWSACGEALLHEAGRSGGCCAESWKVWQQMSCTRWGWVFGIGPCQQEVAEILRGFSCVTLWLLHTVPTLLFFQQSMNNN